MPSLIFYIIVLVGVAVAVWAMGVLWYIKKQKHRKQLEKWFTVSSAERFTDSIQKP